MAKVLGLETAKVIGLDSIDTGVFGGIIVGGLAAALFNRFYRISMPAYLGFFAGKRFVPIVTSFAAIGLGICLSVIWPPIQGGIDAFSNYASHGNTALAVAIYGLVERLLLSFGLHRIWNVPFFFELGSYTTPDGEVVRGVLNRFFAGDYQAGIQGGGFIFKMFGLPVADEAELRDEDLPDVVFEEEVLQTRLRIKVDDPGRVDVKQLQAAGVSAVVDVGGGVYHLLVGLNADQYGAEMNVQLAA